MNDEQKVCAFCDIANGKDDTVEVVATSKHWIAFFPLEPATPGHTLIIPRRHVRDLWKIEDAGLARELIDAVVLVGRAVENVLQPEGMNLISSAGTAAEQTVLHLHLHLVPRWHHDGFGRIWPPKHYTANALKDGLAARIRDSLATELD